ncbi:glycosyltransferase family 2 protein [bacterium]|nr:glycosyltransferase family 2 protein [bacterium]
MSAGPPKVSIVIPAYNEAPRLLKTLRAIDAYLKGRHRQYEIIIVDDGSSDRTVEIARGFVPRAGNMRVLKNHRNLGKGAAVRQGIAAAQGDLILFSDADLSTPIQELAQLEKAVQAGADAAIASRGISGSRVPTRQPFYRELMGKIFNLLVRVITLPGIYDTQCGFKLFRRPIAQSVFQKLTITGFGFDVEALYLIRKSGGRIAEIPVEWHHARGSKVSPLRDAWRMLIDLFRIRMRHRVP